MPSTRFRLASLLLLTASVAMGQRPAATYANPLDLPYRFRLEEPSRREAADPTMLVFHGQYFLFASKSGGYWRSTDLQHWTLIVPTGLPLEDYAPTAVAYKGRVYFTAFNSKAIYSTDDPAKGVWRKDADLAPYGDPDLFVDDDRFYLYSGCSSKTPLMVAELDPVHGFAVLHAAPIPQSRDIPRRGFEVPGENNDAPTQGTWIEGAWMIKHDGRYYLQYAAAQTQLRTYGDGLLTSESPFGPFRYPAYSPVSFKPSGFISGAGHGSTFQDLQGRWWHIASMTVSVRHPYERRLGLFPVSFTADGQMLQDNYLSDLPHRLDGDRSLVGWMQLSLRKQASASSALAGHEPALAADEDVRTWWSATTADAGEWLQLDLGGPATVQAAQVDFADEGSTALGTLHDRYLYRLEGSTDAKRWFTLVDRTRDGRDAPNDYEQLTAPRKVRYVRITNVHMPAGAKFSIAGLRIFGNADIPPPAIPSQLRATRDPEDGRAARLTWAPSDGADFYVVRYGIAPDRLSNSYQVMHGTSLEIRSLNSDSDYVFTVDSVNERGIAAGTTTVSTPHGVAKL